MRVLPLANYALCAFILGAIAATSTPLFGGVKVTGKSRLSGKTKMTASSGDPYQSSVTLLLHGDGADGSTTLTDSSCSGITFTRVGTPSISTAQSVEGGSSIRNLGTSAQATDYYYSSVNAGLSLTGDFTIDSWVYIITQPDQYVAFLSNRGDDGVVGGLQLTITFFNWQATIYDGAWKSLDGGAYVTNTWTHYAIEREGTTIRLYINGVLKDTDTSSATMLGGQVDLLTGNPFNNNGDWNGYVDELRITKGVARYKGVGFTPTMSRAAGC